MLDDPSLYNIANWASSGYVGLVKGALHPDEPLSAQHWIDSAALALSLVGWHKAIQSAHAPVNTINTPHHTPGSGMLDDFADDGLNFTRTAAQHMDEPGRYVPMQTLQEAIKTGTAMADPQGSSAIMYYTTMIKNGSTYNLEVLYEASTNTVYHFLYTTKAIGNLPAIQ